MKYINLIWICLATLGSFAQQQARKTYFSFPKHATVNYGGITVDYAPRLTVKEMPRQNPEEKVQPVEIKGAASKAAFSPTLNPPIKGQSFVANPWGLSTPCDNDIAISNAGILVSVQNTNIYIRNTITHSVSPVKSLFSFTQPLNNNSQVFDPKVMYDPKSDRFVLVSLVGFVDTTSKIIIGFSQTNDPNGNWNLYQLPGNPLNNNLWSDYPMISMTEKELFLSINLLVNNQPWQTGFVETIVWQMKKDSGYAGLPLGSVLHSGINYNGKPIRNLCPVKGGSQLYSPNMYFLSNRNLDAQNDTVFLVNITDTIGAPTGTLTTKCVKSNQQYYFPVDARQTIATQSLATNDSRNLGAFIENNMIQYVHNTNNPVNGRPSIYYGVITNPAGITPTITGYIIPNDTVDFGYPNISYAGSSPTDNTSIINFDHTSNQINPGCSAIRANAAGDFSPILRIQNGGTYVNLLAANVERWGDYTGSQRKYDNPGEVWISAYYGSYYTWQYPYAHSSWIAQVGLSEVLTSVAANEIKEENASANIYPNPATDFVNVQLNTNQPEYLNVELYNQEGKLVAVLLRDWIKSYQSVFSFSTRDLPKGIYFVNVRGNIKTNISQKVIVGGIE